MKTTVIFLLPSLVFSQDFSETANFSIKYYLYTNQKIMEPTILTQSTYNQVNIKHPTKIVVHGFYETAEKIWYKNLTEEYLKKGNFNIIQVDWSCLAFDNYKVSSQNTQIVGYSIGQLIITLYKFYKLSLSNVHLIGHSLGAHVCAYAGKKVKTSLNDKIGRITALDAAGPLFELPFIFFQGISKDDAKIVDAIHTDGGVFGRKDSIGTVDFYPNGGTHFQPGCNLKDLLLHPLTSLQDLIDMIFCSHQKSYRYFINSINKIKYEGIKCDSWITFKQNTCSKSTVAIMGDDYTYSPLTTGRFYLSVN